MTLTPCILVLHHCAAMVVCMENVRIQTSVPVILDGKALIVILALTYLAVCMEAAKVKD